MSDHMPRVDNPGEFIGNRKKDRDKVAELVIPRCSFCHTVVNMHPKNCPSYVPRGKKKRK